ncbi:hypothetical protein [Lactobacillus sp. LL6]|nr:hypothetical protein [Lactobacillus sp. LL6]
MRIIKSVFKWIGLVILAFFVFAFMQVPAVEETPSYQFNSQA